MVVSDQIHFFKDGYPLGTVKDVSSHGHGLEPLILVAGSKELDDELNCKTIYYVDWSHTENPRKIKEYHIQFKDNFPDYTISKIEIDFDGNIWVVAGLARQNVYACFNGTTEFVEVMGGWQIIGDLCH